MTKRKTKITRNYLQHPAGSVLIETGNTKVICTASVRKDVPAFLLGSGKGWITAEYGMLPAATGRRKRRPLLRPDSRGVEIQRLIGRVLRSVVRFDRLGENTVYLDCDVLEADGGTRTAAITGSQVALALAVDAALQDGRCGRRTLDGMVAGVSVGIVDGRAVLDMDYVEDVLREGGKKAREIARPVMEDVRKAVGIVRSF